MTRKFLLAFAFAAAACSKTAPAVHTPSPAAAPKAAPANNGVATAAPAMRPIPGPLPPAPNVPVDSDAMGLPRNWQLLDQASDHIAGVSSERAMKELLAGKQPKRTVLVAVIDGGIDTAHADLKGVLWTNPKEIPGNGKDDDGNGHIDDIHGWNFIGGRDGRNIHQEALEATRIYAGCKKRAKNGDIATLPPAELPECRRAAAEYDKELSDMKSAQPNIQQADQVLTTITTMLKTALKTDSLTDAAVAKLETSDQNVARAKTMYMQLAAQGITRAAIDGAKKDVDTRLKYALDLGFDPRAIVGDDTSNVYEKNYGNGDVMGPDASHGTHVSGIIAASRDGKGIDGIAPAVKIMAVRTIPDGDERDKDVANAIRYAVDNGANIINMSFGKSFSPHKAVVDSAIKYADAHGVLMVHASGNDNANNDSTLSFPTPRYTGGGRPAHWIEVGASSWKGGDELVAEFSNYGKDIVDIFAPGVDILSTMPGDKYEKESGTSMAAPVVTGVAALVMAYYPELTGREIKEILLNSSARHPAQMVVIPGAKNDEKVPFAALSRTAGIVNAYEAIKMAEQVVRGVKQ